MTKRYKDASKIVDEMETSELPTFSQIATYNDLAETKRKASWMRRYAEAIRVEKTGREVHSKRFFLKVDSGHKIRIKVLAKKMIEAFEILDALQARVFDLQYAQDPAYDWIKEFQKGRESRNVDDEESDSVSLSTVLDRSKDKAGQAIVIPAEETDDDDPIELFMRAEKRAYLRKYDFLRGSRERWIQHTLSEEDCTDPHYLRRVNIQLDTLLQYTRRIILNDPVLLLKAEGKVSLNDMFLDPNFSAEDFKRLEEGQGLLRSSGMIWWKDATLEAIAMWPEAGKKSTAANLGDLKDRFKILDGWVFKSRHTREMSNEAWWYLLDALHPPSNIENRFMHLCNDFNDLQTFLSFGALGMYPAPSFCEKQGVESYRAHLSMCGVVVGDCVNGVSPTFPGPLPTTKPASRRDLITWGEVNCRVYMFGAVRDDADTFTRAFLKQLRLRPDRFLVLTRSESDPGQQLEQFGGAADEIFYQLRMRTFEAPMAAIHNPPAGHGPWNVIRSGRDVLYGSGDPVQPGDKNLPGMKGYLTELTTPKNEGWLFWLKKDRFKVKYFVILSAKPQGVVKDLVRDVAWAALCAAGFGRGTYTARKYIRAADALGRQRTSELLSWMPPSVLSYEFQSIEERLKKEGLEWFLDFSEQMGVDV